MLVGDEARLVDAIAKQVAIEGDRLGERRHRDGDLMQLAGADRFHPRGAWYTPKTERRSVQISPSVTRASTAAMIGGTRFALPRAAVSRSARARSAAAWSRFARRARRRSARPRTTASSTRWSGGTESS